MNYHFKIHKEKKGYWAECLELPGCLSQGDNMKELEYNMAEALSLYLNEPEESKTIFPLPNTKYLNKGSVKEVEVDSNVAFAFLLRRSRLINGLTQTQMKNKLNFKNLFSYQKLEMPKYANPTLKSLRRIKEALPDFPFRLLL